MTVPLSWASLEVFQDCKLRWKLQYCDNIRLPVNQKPFLVGSAVHDTLEGWYRAGWEPDFVQANIQRIFNETVRGMVATEGAFIYPLLNQQIVPVPLSEQRLAAHRQVLDNMVMDIASGRVGWNPSTGSHCLRCPYYRTPHCPATLREEVLKDDGEITRE